LRRLFLNLRLWDFAAAARVDHFLANSLITQDRIATHYRRESIVVPPPIDTERFTPGGQSGDYYLVVSRNVPYKRIDLAVAATQRLGRRLIVVGEGTDRLKSASPHVTFRGKIDQAELLALMRGARALLAPQLEDFGMAILEMNACGRPVIAYGKGGALETLIDGKTGVLFYEQSVEALCEAVVRFESLSFDPAYARQRAESFSKERYIATMRNLVVDLRRTEPTPRTFSGRIAESAGSPL
jgi:glycosyltransferase involved in cell wall biosynthesis